MLREALVIYLPSASAFSLGLSQTSVLSAGGRGFLFQHSSGKQEVKGLLALLRSEMENLNSCVMHLTCGNVTVLGPVHLEGANHQQFSLFFFLNGKIC